MEIKKGIPVSPGVAICPAVVLDSEDITIPRRQLSTALLPAEHKRLDTALAEARAELEGVRDTVETDLGSETAAIFGFHLGMLQDQHLIKQFHDFIDAEEVSAEFALASVMRKLATMFKQQSDPLFRERVSDIWDVERRVLHQLIDNVHTDLEGIDQEAIVIAHDLTPSQTASLNQSKIVGLATDAGGRTSHTAIVARALGIPAVVGLEDITASINAKDIVIVDGNRGLLIINPDKEQLDEYEGYVRRIRDLELKLDDLSLLPAQTLDGIDVSLSANIEFASEIPGAQAKGAVGIGLYRTEYLFLSTESEPDEEKQFDAFIEALEALDGQPIIIRTLDLGADKYTQKQALNPEPNPFLGCRSIRYCLQNLTMFKTHLRAILRASAFGDVRIMFPLISNMMELRQARMILNDVMEDLEDEGIAFDRDIKIGIMIEVPSAALMAKHFAREVDFFSIGTNDLVQYTLAVDRANEHVASLYSAAHPAVITLIKDVLRAAKRGEIETSLCGEMAGEVQYTMLLLGMGLRHFSMTPQAIPAVKQIIRSVTLKDCERVARRVSSYDSERQVLNYLREETRKIIPEAFDGRSIV